jgi:cytochrome P450
MPYLYKVIRESLRICPPIPVVFRKATEDVTLSGYFIPKGVRPHLPSPLFQHSHVCLYERGILL